MLNLKRKLTNKLLAYLWKTSVSEDDVLTWDGKTMMWNGRALDKGEIQDLQSQAQTLKSMALWQLLQKSMEHTAHNRLFKEAAVPDDLIFGKAILYTEDVRQKIVDNLIKLQP